MQEENWSTRKPVEASLDWKPKTTKIQRRDGESNPGSVVYNAEEVPLRYLLPQNNNNRTFVAGAPHYT